MSVSIREESNLGGLDDWLPLPRGNHPALHEDTLALRLYRGKRIRDPSGYIDAPRFIFQHPVASGDERRNTFACPSTEHAFQHDLLFGEKSWIFLDCPDRYTTARTCRLRGWNSVFALFHGLLRTHCEQRCGRHDDKRCHCSCLDDAHGKASSAADKVAYVRSGPLLHRERAGRR